MSSYQFFPEKLLQEIRTRFCYLESDPVGGERVWLESASGALRLEAAVEALAAQTRYPDQLGRANPGSKYAGDIVAKGLEDVKLFLGAKSGTIAPGMSSTHTAFRVVNAVLGRSKGGNVVTTDLEHPCIYDSTWKFAEMYGKEWRVAHLDPETGFVPPERILEMVDRQTELVAMIHGSNITGAVLDVKTVAREARKINPEVFILVDGVQYAPHAPVDVDDLAVDAYVFGPYKAFSVKGIGFAYLSDRVATLDHWKLRGTPAGSWSLGSPEDPTYAAWSAVVDYLSWLGSHFTESESRRDRVTAGMRASEGHVQSLLYRLLHGNGHQRGLLSMEHVTLHGATEQVDNRVCLVLMSLDRLDSSRAVDFYNSHRIRVHNRVQDAYSKHTLGALGIKEGVRPSACHYNSAEEIDRFLEVTEELGTLSAIELERLVQESHQRGPGEG